MPLNSPPLCVTLHVKNLCDIEKELKVFKQLLCDCSVKSNRLRKEARRVECPHKDVVEIRPAIVRIKANSIVELELTFRYVLLNQQEVHFTLAYVSGLPLNVNNISTIRFSRSASRSMKLQMIVNTLEFDPLSLFTSNQLSPVAINLYPVPQQNCWFYNPFINDIKIRLISKSPELILAADELVVKSHQYSPLLLTFAPNHVGSFEV